MVVNCWERPLVQLCGCKLDSESVSDLDEIASKLGVNRSVIIRKAIWEFLDRNNKESKENQNLC